MLIFEWILGILLGSVLLSALARRLRVPYPALMALGGALLAFIPGAPRIVLEPELALALFVAPVLLDAAYDTSPRDLRDTVPIAPKPQDARCPIPVTGVACPADLDRVLDHMVIA